jgi:hypothetical protein
LTQSSFFFNPFFIKKSKIVNYENIQMPSAPIDLVWVRLEVSSADNQNVTAFFTTELGEHFGDGSSGNSFLGNGSVLVSQNPSGDFVNIEYNVEKEIAAVSIRLFDQFGQLLINDEKQVNKGLQKKQINLAALNTGIYFIQITIDGVSYSKPILKIK